MRKKVKAINKGKIKCPKCKIEMKIVQFEDCETDECPKCGGIWVDYIEEKKALKMKPMVFAAHDVYHFRKMYEPSGKTDDVKYFPCPRCGDMMWRKNYMSHSGVIVDRCNNCGTFFDKGELEKAVEFIKLGGVEFEKFQTHQRGIADSHSKLLRKINDVECTMFKLHWTGRFLSMMGF